MIKKSLFDTLGCFDERFPHAALEDVEFRYRLKKGRRRLCLFHRHLCNTLGIKLPAGKLLKLGKGKNCDI